MEYQELLNKLPLISTDRLNSFYDYTNNKVDYSKLSNYLNKKVVLGHKTFDGSVELFATIMNIDETNIILSVKGTEPFVEIPINEVSYLCELETSNINPAIINQVCTITNYENNSITCFITEINDYEIELYIRTDNDIELSYYPTSFIKEIRIIEHTK